jgi:serine O-acetyltransferase
MKKYNRESFAGGLLYPKIAHYNHKKFWFIREIVVNDTPHRCKLIRLIYLIKIKRMESHNCASFGTAFNAGAQFRSMPILPHGITGSFISHTAKIGSNCVIMQNVIIGSSRKKAPTIGDNCIIGAGAVIIGGIVIGNNVHIGANCTVAESVPSDTTVVMPHPRIIHRETKKTEDWVF